MDALRVRGRCASILAIWPVGLPLPGGRAAAGRSGASGIPTLVTMAEALAGAPAETPARNRGVDARRVEARDRDQLAVATFFAVMSRSRPSEETRTTA